MKKKICIALLSLVCGIACVFGFAACGDTTPKHTHDYQWTDNGDGTHNGHCIVYGCNEPDISNENHIWGMDAKCTKCKAVKPVVVENMKMDNFLAENQAIAEMFIGDNIRPQAITAADEDVKSEKCTLVASSSKEELHAVNFVYTVKLDDTKRAVKISTVTLNEDLPFNNIVEHYSSQSKLASGDLVKAEDVTVKTDTIFEFDAKINHDKQNVADAIFKAINSKSDLKLYAEQETTQAGYSKFTTLSQDGNTYTVKAMEVVTGNGSDESLIENLGYSSQVDYIRTVSTHTVDGVEFYNTAYTLENIQGGHVNPGPGTEITITKEEITTALDTNCKENIVNHSLAIMDINHDLVSNGKWYVTQNEEGEITQAEYAYNYNRSSTDVYYNIGKVEFESPINAKDLVDGKIQGANYSGVYSNAYNPTIQSSRQELTNAICDKVFETNGTVLNRYIVDNGAAESDSVLSGTVRMFTVIEVTDKGVQQANINIKTSANDAEYISKLASENDHRIFDKVSYELSGNEVEDMKVTLPSTENTVSQAKTSF